MKKKIFIDDEYSYDLEQTENKVSLHYSNNGIWSCPGEHIFSLVDDGDGYKIKGSFYKKGKVQYGELNELYILFSVLKDSKIEVFEKVEEL